MYARCRRRENGRIRQSIMGWCFNPRPAPVLAKHCKDIGLVAMEGISSKSYPYVRELGLNISLVGSHGFKKGPVSPENRDYCIQKLRDAIDLAKQRCAKCRSCARKCLETKRNMASTNNAMHANARRAKTKDAQNHSGCGFSLTF